MADTDISDVKDELEALDTEKGKSRTVAKAKKLKKAEKAEEKPVKVGKSAKTEKTEEKPVKAEKAAKKEKEPEVDPDPAPKEYGGVWPFRPGSVMLYCFRACVEGISKSAFKKMFTPEGDLVGYYSEDGEGNVILKGKALAAKMESAHDFMLARMKRGVPGRRQDGPSHSWKWTEEGGRYRIYDVRYLLGKKVKAEPVSKKKEKKAA
jgi:hypothetical protein